MKPVVLVVLGLSLSGCLPTSDPLPVRYYHPLPELSEEDASFEDSPLLRLSPVKGMSHLKERAVWRNPSGEMGFYEDERWAAMPVDYLEQALTRDLFESGRFRRSVRADQTLEVRLLSFDHVRTSPSKVRIEIMARLSATSAESLFETRFVQETEVAGTDFINVSQAMGRSLDACVERLTERVQQATRGFEEDRGEREDE